ncbi:filamentous hemagglutinin N-terminal domain-containing protein [Rivularia sp. PCC 7116]|uniref:two-partner secretion domain-containing protein n=1 Tax=Rivularia sp. PCC 7116 TaxID=373994 RepID=UPI00031FF3A8|nr:filamentous hemagglutinin N-terminal domain-containing protein [Rivularia sp. PCC 7116]
MKAQLIPDNSLGKENSTVNPSMERDLIEGGAIRNNNLFHSFKEFNVNPSQKVYFSNPDSITNILTRVTGNNASKILGTLGVDGNANLFLINPKGIIFGENAFLDIAGSLSATTAESIFIDNYEFSAVNLNETPLLKISLTPGLQYGKINPQSEIENRGVLKVGEKQNLTLLGGRVFHQDTGSLIAPGGKVEVSGSDINLKGTVDTRGSNGEVGTLLIDPKNILIEENGNLSGDDISQTLAVNNVVLQANNDITVDDDITGIGTNNLTLEAGRSLTIGENRNIFLTGGSFNAKINDENALPSERDAGIAEFKMNPQSSIITNGGDVNVVSGSFANNSQINTLSAAILSYKINGTSGNINLSAIGDIATGRLISGILNPDDDSSLNAGDININSTNGDILTTDFIFANSLIKAGNITLKAENNINLTAQQAVETGNISSIGGRVAGSINLDGENILSQNVRTLNGILGNGIGNDINVNTKSLTVENGSIIALTFGESNGGNLFINADEEMILRQSSVATNADGGSSGDAGNLTINTKRLTVQRIPSLPSPFGVGIGTRTDTNTTGNSGDLTINATESIEIIGDRPGSFVPQANQVVNSLLRGDDRTGITTSAEGSGMSGKLIIDTSRLIVRDNAAIVTAPFFGGGGDLNISAKEIFLTGEAGIGTGNLFGENAGDLKINAEKVILLNGANIGTASFEQGNAGNLELSVAQLSISNGSTINSATIGEGNGGNLIIKDAQLIEVIGTSEDGSFPSNISASSLGSGNSGNLNITTDKLNVRDGGEITTATDINGIGGNIDINTRTLEINDGRINASTTTPQKGGNININASESIEVIGGGFDKLQENIIIPAFDGNKNSLTLNNFDNGIVTASQGEGDSGNILINTPNFKASNGGLIATTTLNQGAGGDITINASDILEIDNSLLGTGTFTTENSGNIALTARQLIAKGGAQILTTTFDAGKAGNLNVNISDSIDLIDPSEQGFTSGLFATSFQNASGDGGNITVKTGNFNIVDRAAVSVSGEGVGNAGNIDIEALKLFLDNSSITAQSVSGEGGNITLTIADLLLLRNNSTISTRAGTENSGGGNGGNITINGGLVVAAPNENSDINANAFQGNGGNIDITTPGIFGIQFREQTTPQSDITASSEFGIDGDFDLNLQELDITSGLVELPENLTDAADRISAGCPTDEEARFVTSGRGGIPQNPKQTLQNEVVLQDLRNIASTPSTPSTLSSPSQIKEATGWIVNKDGDIEFIADNRIIKQTTFKKDSCQK